MLTNTLSEIIGNYGSSPSMTLVLVPVKALALAVAHALVRLWHWLIVPFTVQAFGTECGSGTG